MLRVFVGIVSVAALSSNFSAYAGPTHPSPLNGQTGLITYVDATHSDSSGLTGNTQLASGAALQAGTTLTNVNANDNLWRFSPNGNFGVNFPGTPTGQSVYESNAANTVASAAGENAPRLMTTVSLPSLSPGTPLHVYVYFWTDNNASWRIQAGLTNPSGPLTLFSANDGMGSYLPGTPQTENLGPPPGLNVSPSGYFTNPVITSQGTFSLMEGYLGVGFVNFSNNLEVFIDDDDITGAPGHNSQPGRNFRTWYDGIGLVSATPGSSQQIPILPPSVGPNGMTFPSVPRRRWFDPPLVDRYDFSIDPGSLFTLAALPLGFNDDFDVYVNNSLVGTFDGGEEVDFVSLLGNGVSSFSVRGISPLVDAQNTQGFPIFLDFSTETATFTMTPVPEPWLVSLSAQGLLGLMAIRRKRGG